MGSPKALEAIGRTPLIELKRLRPPGGARVLVKWEGANPTGSMKDRAALAIVRSAEREGFLAPGQRIVDYTFGNDGVSLAYVAAATDHPVTLVTADSVSEEKITAMRTYGADVEVLETPEHKVHAGLLERLHDRVETLEQEASAYWCDHMHNLGALEGYRSLGDEILAAAPRLTEFVMVVGTAGAAMGTARALRDAVPDVRVSLVEPVEAPFLSRGLRGHHGVEGVGLGIRPPLLDNALYDRVIALREEEARLTRDRLASEENVHAGTSTGMNVAAALRAASELPPDSVVVTVAADRAAIRNGAR